MRHKHYPMLDAEQSDCEDRFGPLDSDTRSAYNLCGLDRFVSEGIVDLPEGSRDPLELLLEDGAVAFLDDPFDGSTPPGGRKEDGDVLTFTRFAELFTTVRVSHDGRGRTWFAPGFGPGSDPSDRRGPITLIREAHGRARRAVLPPDLEALRYEYSR